MDDYNSFEQPESGALARFSRVCEPHHTRGVTSFTVVFKRRG
jgi:hypothetical protein